MRWRDFRLWEKVAIVVLGLWFTLGWFVAGLFPNPRLFMDAPYLVIFGTISLLTVIGWVLRRLGH